MRTWVMRTDSDGFCYFDSSYVVSGDPFYIGAAGTPTFPLGTVTVQETKAPEGYVLSSAARPERRIRAAHYKCRVLRGIRLRSGMSINSWTILSAAA